MYQLKNKLNKEDCVRKLAEETFKRVTLSFYCFTEIKHVRQRRDEIFRDWDAMGVLGRVYLSKEGANAQINVPEPNMEEFRAWMEASEFKGTFLNIALDQEVRSFWRLCIKLRDQIVTHGLDNLDMSKRGDHLTAEEFNAALDEGITVIDMRNFYESRIGHFENAIKPDSHTFKEQLPMVLEELEGKEEEPVLMYCTGGIRCEPASAFLKQNGFKNVKQLQGGIINYTKQVRENGLESKFKGANFVFDERLAERVTDEVISDCDQCDAKSDTYTNCANASCNLLFIQCAACHEKHEGSCSEECLAVVQLPEAERRAHYAKQKSTDYDIYKSRIRPNLKKAHA